MARCETRSQGRSRRNSFHAVYSGFDMRAGGNPSAGNSSAICESLAYRLGFFSEAPVTSAFIRGSLLLAIISTVDMRNHGRARYF
jgi:hypothetical protein